MDTARKTLRWLPFVFILALVPVAALLGSSAEATVDIPAANHTVQVHEGGKLAPDEPIAVEALSPSNDPMVQYLYESMRTWTKLPDEIEDAAQVAKAHELASKSAAGSWAGGAVDAEKRAETLSAYHAKARARYASIAADIVKVVRSEKSAFPSDENRVRTAVLVAGVAFFEAGFAQYVDSGLCNDWKWRHPTTTGPGALPADEVKNRKAILQGGSCDGGWAYSMWQIHPFDNRWAEGIVLLDDAREWAFAEYVHGERKTVTDAEGQEHEAIQDADGKTHPILKGKDLIADRQAAARVALHMLRRSLGPKAEHGLCGYTGEGNNCWKASLRENFAKDWWAKHPFAG